MRVRHVCSFMFVVSLGCGGVVGCEDSVDDVTNTVTCADVCDRYQDCIDEDFDVADCTSTCEDRSEDEDLEAQLEECDACLDDTSCVAGAFECADDCAGVIDVTQ